MTLIKRALITTCSNLLKHAFTEVQWGMPCLSPLTATGIEDVILYPGIDIVLQLYCNWSTIAMAIVLHSVLSCEKQKAV